MSVGEVFVDGVVSGKAYTLADRKKAAPIIVDPWADKVAEKVQDCGAVRIALIQHHETIPGTIHGHTFGDLLKYTCEHVGRRSGGPAVSMTKFDYRPSEVDGAKLKGEVQSIFRDLGTENLAEIHAETPIPQILVRKASERDLYGELLHPELNKMKQIADAIAKANHGIALPGGYHLNPLFYGQTLSSAGSGSAPCEIDGYDEDMRRAIMEFFLIHAAKVHGRPLLGVCRGYQALNVYHGGILDRVTLKKNQVQVTRRVSRNSNCTLLSIADRTFFAHSQALVKAGRGLQKVAGLDYSAEKNRILFRLLADSAADAELVFGTQSKFLTAWAKADGCPLLLADIVSKRLHSGPSKKSLSDNFYSAQNRLVKRLRAAGEELTAMRFVSNNVVLAVESDSGVPLLGVQWHPEGVNNPDVLRAHLDLSSNANEELIAGFVELAKVQRTKMLALDALRARFQTN